MLPALDVLRRALAQVLVDKEEQGHDTSGLDEELARLPDSYDAVVDFAERLAQLPLRDGWPYVEPDDLETIRRESDPGRATGPRGPLAGDASPRAETAFLSAVCGCILGKPLESSGCSCSRAAAPPSPASTCATSGCTTSRCWPPSAPSGPCC